MAACVAVGIAGAVQEGGAQGLLRVGGGRGQLGIEVRALATAFGDRAGLSDQRYREWVTLPFSGSLIDTRAFSWSLTLRPVLTQGLSNQLDNTVVSRSLDLDFSARLLSSRPISLSFATTRSGGSSTLGALTLTDYTNTTTDANMSIRWRPFPVRLSYSRRAVSQTWNPTPLVDPVERSYRVRTLRFAGNSSKASARLERTNYDGIVGGDDFVAWNGQFDHRFRWGKGSTLQSSIGFTDRDSRVSPYRQVSWSERLRLQHTHWLGTNYQYRVLSSRINGTRASTRSYGAGIEYRISRWVSGSVRGSARSSELINRTTSVRSIIPSLQFTVPTPRIVRLRGGVAVGYERRREDGTGDGFIPVLNERHRVDDTRLFELDNPEVDLASLMVRSADGTLVYLRDLDYEVQEVGGFLRIIVPITSRIQVGEVLLVTYRFRAATRRRDRTVTGNYSVSLGVSRFTLRHRQSLRGTDSDVQAGALTIPDFNEMVTQLDGTQPTPVGLLRISAERRRRTTDRFRNTVWEARGTLTLPSVRRLRLSLGGGWNRSMSEDQRVTMLFGNASVVWMTPLGVRMYGRLDGLRTERADAGFERFLGGLIEANWRFAQVETIIRFEHQRRNVGTAGAVSRFSFRAVRRF